MATSNTKSARWPSLLARYFLGCIIVFWLIRTDNIDLTVVKAINLRVAATALILAALQFILAGWRVRILLRTAGIHVSLWRCIAYNAVGIFFSIFLPGGISGDVARAYYFWHCDTARGASKSALLGALLTDRVIGSIVMILIGLIASTLIANTLGLGKLFLVAGWLGFVTGGLIYMRLCQAESKHRPVTIMGYSAPWLSRLASLLANMDIRSLPRPMLLSTITLSIGIHLSAIVLIFLFADLLKSGTSFWQVTGLAPFGLLVNMIPLSPGGLGIGEQGFQSLFALVGGTQGGNTFLLARIFFSAPALLGLIVLIHSFIKAHRVIRFDEADVTANSEMPNPPQ
ncbi:MAG: flippase-like domain-containing protein [Betaproteobacteria bacterium]|nr:flippase-like domain-containing protein [Betaproteobacteria bacterium]